MSTNNPPPPPKPKVWRKGKYDVIISKDDRGIRRPMYRLTEECKDFDDVRTGYEKNRAAGWYPWDTGYQQNIDPAEGERDLEGYRTERRVVVERGDGCGSRSSQRSSDEGGAAVGGRTRERAEGGDMGAGEHSSRGEGSQTQPEQDAGSIERFDWAYAYVKQSRSSKHSTERETQ